MAALFPDGSTAGWFTPVINRRWKKRGRTPTGKPKYGSESTYDAKGMFTILHQLKQREQQGYEISLVIENQQGFPNDSKKAVMSVGMGYGRWLQTIELVGLDYQRVMPSQWKPHYLSPGASKEVSLKVARRLWPQMELDLKKHEAIAEALLVADFTRRKTNGLEFPRKPPPPGTRKPKAPPIPAGSLLRPRPVSKDKSRDGWRKQPRGKARRKSVSFR